MGSHDLVEDLLSSREFLGEHLQFFLGRLTVESHLLHGCQVLGLEILLEKQFVNFHFLLLMCHLEMTGEEIRKFSVENRGGLDLFKVFHFCVNRISLLFPKFLLLEHKLTGEVDQGIAMKIKLHVHIVHSSLINCVGVWCGSGPLDFRFPLIIFGN